MEQTLFTINNDCFLYILELCDVDSILSFRRLSKQYFERMEIILNHIKSLHLLTPCVADKLRLFPNLQVLSGTLHHGENIPKSLKLKKIDISLDYGHLYKDNSSFNGETYTLSNDYIANLMERVHSQFYDESLDSIEEFKLSLRVPPYEELLAMNGSHNRKKGKIQKGYEERFDVTYSIEWSQRSRILTLDCPLNYREYYGTFSYDTVIIPHIDADDIHLISNMFLANSTVIVSVCNILRFAVNVDIYLSNLVGKNKSLILNIPSIFSILDNNDKSIAYFNNEQTYDFIIDRNTLHYKSSNKSQKSGKLEGTKQQEEFHLQVNMIDKLKYAFWGQYPS